jgi:phosphoribosylamine--glycine ligase
VKILVVGQGAREHALVWAFSRSPLVGQVLCAPGNPGIAELAERHSVAPSDFEGVVELARDVAVDLVVIGPEDPLVGGLADALRAEGIKTFGPGAKGARLEGSKAYAKKLMASKNIPTAMAREFSSAAEAIRYVSELASPVVVKADGLAAGKGVTVCDTIEIAERAILEAMEERRFGDSGEHVLIEEKMEGEEVSILAFCDGRDVAVMEPAQDFKRVFDGDRGPNTGGMGSYSPVPICPPELVDRVTDEVLEPIASALAEAAEPYIGVIYAGLMLTTDGVKVVEFNCRFGDPEIQSLVARMDFDLTEAILACVEGDVTQVKLAWTPQAAVTAVIASEGYPADYRTGLVIEGLEEAEDLTGLPVFHAGTKSGPSGEVLTDGGRVLAVTALGDDHGAARVLAYSAAEKITFPGKMMRSDIALRVSKRRTDDL